MMSNPNQIRNNRNRNLVVAPIPRNIKLAMRSMAKQNNQASVLVSGPNDPPNIRRDILVQKVVSATTTAASVSFTYASIYALLDPQATPFFTHIRVIKISVFGPPSTSSSVNQPFVSVSINYDGAFFTDRGVGTARAPCLHVRLPQFVRNTWASTTDTTPVAVVQLSGTHVQVTIEVRADTSADT
jgi:hypothetical protein